MDLADIKANIAALQKGAAMLDTRNYLVPQRKVIFYDFLTHLEILSSNEVYHIFNPTDEDMKYDGDPDFFLVIHNHGPNRSCTTPDFCHVHGYEPPDACHPGFRKAFWNKNGIHYKRDSIRSNSSGNSLPIQSRSSGLDLSGFGSFLSSKE